MYKFYIPVWIIYNLFIFIFLKRPNYVIGRIVESAESSNQMKRRYKACVIGVFKYRKVSEGLSCQ